MTPALDLYARSDFGRVLGEIWERRSELLNRDDRAGDHWATGATIGGRRGPTAARDGAAVPRGYLADAGADERWGTGDSAIFQYARAVDALYRCANLSELERSLERSIKTAF